MTTTREAAPLTCGATKQPTIPPRQATVDVSAALFMVSEIQRYEGRFEMAFACGWDPVTRQITSARVLGRGSATRAFFPPERIAAGEIYLHNHPNGDMSPSDADLEAAKYLSPRGCGFGIISNDLRELYLVCEPAPIALPPPVNRTRIWTLGPLTLVYTRPRAHHAERES